MSLGMTADGKNVALSMNAPESAPTKQNQPQAKPQPQSQPKSQPTTSAKNSIPVPQLLTIKVDLQSLTTNELDNVIKQLRQKAVDAREAEKQGKVVIGGSGAIESDYKNVKDYADKVKALESTTKNQPAPKPQANVRTEESVFNNLIKEFKEGKTTTFDSLSIEGKMYLLKQLHSNNEFDALLYYDTKVTNDESNQITKKYGITDFNTSILDQLASDPEKYNEFVNNLTFVGPEIIKSQDEVQDEVCNGTTADINTNSPVVDAKPKIDPNNYFDDLGDF
jgi:hypothetical protein